MEHAGGDCAWLSPGDFQHLFASLNMDLRCVKQICIDLLSVKEFIKGDHLLLVGCRQNAYSHRNEFFYFIFLNSFGIEDPIEGPTPSSVGVSIS